MKMSLKKQIQQFVLNYLVLFAIITIFNVVLSQLFFSQVLFDGQQFLRIMLFALVGTLPSILLRPTELSKMRLIVHFAVLELSVVSLGVVIGLVRNLRTGTLYVVVVGLIYMLVRFLCWQEDKAVANKINEKLKNMKWEENEKSE
jgi:hypothetical protein